MEQALYAVLMKATEKSYIPSNFLNDSQLKSEVKNTGVFQNLGKYLPNDTE